MLRKTLLSFLFLISGFSTLAYQVVWQKVLTQEVGVDTLSISFIVAIFLAGIGLGSWIHSSTLTLSYKQKRNLYVALELGIGFFGIASIVLLREANQIDAFGTSVVAQFSINFLVLLPATMAMGLSTPLILDLARVSDRFIGSTLGLFYGNNILGAAMGAIATGFVLVELCGLQGVVVLAAMINVFLGAAYWMVLRDRADTPRLLAVNSTASALAPVLLVVAFLFGFASLNLQMIYFRTAYNHFQVYAFVFPVVLSVFLLSMASGQYIFGVIADRVSQPLSALGIGISAYALALLIAYRVPIEAVQATSLEEFWPPFVRFLWIFSAPVAIGAGLFTVLVRYSTQYGAELGTRFGQMMATASLGNVVGALLAPFFLFELIGTMGVLLLSTVAYVVGYLLIACAGPPRLSRVGIVGASTALAISIFLPWNYFMGNRMFFLPENMAFDITEDPVGIVSTFKYDDSVSIQVSRTGTSTIFVSDRPGYEMAPLEHFLPSEGKAEMLIIGMGGANYLPRLVNLEQIGRITVVELSGAIIEKVREHGTTSIREAMDSPKVEFVQEDGRRYLTRAVRMGMTWSVIQNGVFQPWMSGASNLYTAEFARLLNDALTPGGLLVTLDLEHIATTMGVVFPVAYSAFPDRYLYYPKSGGSQIDGLCRRQFEGEGVISTDDRPVMEYWAMALFNQTLAEVLGQQAKSYESSC